MDDTAATGTEQKKGNLLRSLFYFFGNYKLLLMFVEILVS